VVDTGADHNNKRKTLLEELLHKTAYSKILLRFIKMSLINAYLIDEDQHLNVEESRGYDRDKKVLDIALNNLLSLLDTASPTQPPSSVIRPQLRILLNNNNEQQEVDTTNLEKLNNKSYKVADNMPQVEISLSSAVPEIDNNNIKNGVNERPLPHTHSTADRSQEPVGVAATPLSECRRHDCHRVSSPPADYNTMIDTTDKDYTDITIIEPSSKSIFMGELSIMAQPSFKIQDTSLQSLQYYEKTIET